MQRLPDSKTQRNLWLALVILGALFLVCFAFSRRAEAQGVAPSGGGAPVDTSNFVLRVDSATPRYAVAPETHAAWSLGEAVGTAAVVETTGTYQATSVTGTPTTTPSPFPGTPARSFDGTSGLEVTASAASAALIRDGDFTIGLTVRRNTDISSAGTLFAVGQRGGAASGTLFTVHQESNAIYLGYGRTTNTITNLNAVTASHASTAKWTSFVFTRSGSAFRLYVNGVLAASTTASGLDSVMPTLASITDPVFMFAMGAKGKAKAAISNVWVEAGARTADEVLARYMGARVQTPNAAYGVHGMHATVDGLSLLTSDGSPDSGAIVRLGTIGTLSSTDYKLMSILGSGGAEKLYLDFNGNVLPATNDALNLGSSSLRFSGAYISTLRTQALQDTNSNPRVSTATSSNNTYTAQASSGATAIAHRFGNGAALTDPGAKIAAFYSDNLTTERAFIDKDGGARFNGASVIESDTTPLVLKTKSGGATPVMLSIGGSTTTASAGNFMVNAYGSIYTQGNILTVDAYNGKVGINSSNPAGYAELFTVAGSMKVLSGVSMGVTSLGTCDATNRGMQKVLLDDAAGDTAYFCRRAAGGTFAWTAM